MGVSCEFVVLAGVHLGTLSEARHCPVFDQYRADTDDVFGAASAALPKEFRLEIVIDGMSGEYVYVGRKIGEYTDEWEGHNVSFGPEVLEDVKRFLEMTEFRDFAKDVRFHFFAHAH